MNQQPWPVGALGLPAVVDRATFQAELDELRVREKAHTREGDAIAAARRRLPMVEVDAEPRADRARRAGHPARRVRRAPSAHRLLLHVAPRPPRGRAVRRLHVGHEPGRGAVLPALPRHHLRGLLQGRNVASVSRPQTSTREPSLPRLHGLGHALVLRPALPRRAPGRPRNRLVPPGVLPAGRRPRLRDLLDEPSRRGGHGLQLRAHGPHRVRAPGDWEDSPAGWPQQCSNVRTDGGSPGWPPVSEWPGGRPIAQWPRLAAGKESR